MNSHSYPGRTSKSNESPFAREVYRAEEAPESRSAVLDEIAALRAEVRTEVRALRGAMSRPRPNNELSVELAGLRAWPIACEVRSLVALVGPAGVGKTTTAAKLGARCIRKNKTVAFVSCDSYRVGALDQLRKYAELMDSEFHAVTSPDDLLTVIMGITADVIIVDTSGRAVEQGSVEAMLGDGRLRLNSSLKRHVEVMLCTPAALRGQDAGRIARDFAPTEPTSLCVTKLDETDQPSALVHAPFATKLPIATLCFGQRVPEDVGPATHTEIIARLVPGATQNKATNEVQGR